MAEQENSSLEDLGNEMFMRDKDRIDSEFNKEISRLYVKAADIGHIPLGKFVELSVNRLRDLCLARIKIDETLISEQEEGIDDSQAERMIAHVENVLANQFGGSLNAVSAAARAGGLERTIPELTRQLERERAKILEDMKREINIKKGLSRLSSSEKEKVKKGEVESAIEHELQRETVGILRLITGYFTTWWGIFKYPKITLRSLLSAEREPGEGMPAAAFLVINILVVLLIRGQLGDTLLKFPFEVHWALNIIPFVLRYLLGMIVFLFLFTRLTTKRGVINYMFEMFPVFCYASVIFVPFFLIRELSSRAIGTLFVNILLSFISGLPIKLSMGSYMKLFLSIIFILAFFIWWLWLLYVGLEYLKPIQPKKKRLKNLASAYFHFLLVKVAALLVVSFLAYGSTLVAFKIIALQEIERALSTQPPNYGKAYVLSEEIANAKGMPVYFRYVAKLKSMIYQIAIIAPDDSREQVVAQAQKAGSDHDFERVEKIIRGYVQELLINKRDPRRSVYAQVAKSLEEAVELRNSPHYVEQDMQYFGFIFPPAPIALFP